MRNHKPGKKLRIGYYHAGYPERRNIIGIVPHLDYVRVHDLYDALQRLAAVNRRLFKHSFFNVNHTVNRFNDLNLNRVDILHFFNAFSFGKTPWISTFEEIVPRFTYRFKARPDSPISDEKRILAALEVMSGDPCKRLIALSECALNMQKEFLSRFPRYSSKIESKLIQLHPPQQAFFDNYENKHLDLDGQINFAFVGSGFFKKGGPEMLEALSDLRKESGLNLRLTIVSSLTKSMNYVGAQDVKIARETIERSRDWIDYYFRLPNEQVIEMMRKAHVGLLPTHEDTYGYCVLEFQACGCPVISTNVSALPEINNDQIGWVIEIPNKYLKKANDITEEDRIQIKNAIKIGLKGAVHDIFKNRDIIPRKANAALEKIKNQHSPENYAMRISEIYEQALRG
jgi:glycosyltransferase involved in cell wall biosynthesis